MQAEAHACERYLERTFGFHAAQLGMPELNGLDVVRMPHRWLLLQPGQHHKIGQLNPAVQAAAHVWAHYCALPFASGSLDLLILPHALEWQRDPTHCLQEVERVLAPHGTVLIFGFNPRSIWRISSHTTALPANRHWHSIRSLKKTLSRLHFAVESEHLPCYSPPVQSPFLIRQGQHLDALSSSLSGTVEHRLGSKFSGIGSGVYCLKAIKQVENARTIKPKFKAQWQRNARALALQPKLQ